MKPRYNHTEQLGIIKTYNLFVEQFLWIFREQPLVDVGIDAHVEIVDNGNPTGKLLALQIKTGGSYFHEAKTVFTFYFDEAHFNYWTNYTLPVILVGYLPNKDLLIWTFVKKETIIKTNKRYKIDIPKTNILGKSNSKSEIERIYNFNNASLKPQPNYSISAYLNDGTDDINFEIEKELTELNEIKNISGKKYALTNSRMGLEIFKDAVYEILSKLDEQQTKYSNDSFRFHTKRNQTDYFLLSTVNYTVVFNADQVYDNTASDANISLRMYKGPYGLGYGVDYNEPIEEIYNENYKFSFDDLMNPVFVNRDDLNLVLGVSDIYKKLIKDIVIKEAQLQKGRFN